MKGDQRLEHIVFRNGALFVPRNQQTLQRLLSLYHPHRDKLFYEWKPAEVAEDQIDFIEINARLSEVYENIVEAKDPLPEAKKYESIKNKRELLGL